MIRSAIGLVCVMILAESAYGSFSDIGLGARPMGMGGAFVAIADDANSTFWNPAGLSQLQRFEFSSMHVNLYGLDVNSQLLSGTYRHPFAGGVGVGILRTGETGLYTEDSLIFAMGQDLHPFIRTHLSIGMCLKQLHKGYQGADLNDPLFERGTDISQLSYDVGFLWRSSDDSRDGISGMRASYLRLAGMVENLVPVEVNLDGDDDHREPPVFRLGAAIQPAPRMMIAAEAVQRQIDGPFVQRSGRVGIEWQPLSSLIGLASAITVRAGVRLKRSAERWESTANLGSGLQLSVSELFTTRLDYAFSLPVATALSDSLGNNHRVSLSLALGGMEADRAAPTLTEPVADPTQIENGQALALMVKSESGLSVSVDILAIDTTRPEPIAFTESETEPGSYSASVVISKSNTAGNGPKTIVITGTDAAGNLSKPVTVIVELHNFSEEEWAQGKFRTIFGQGIRYAGQEDYQRAIQRLKVASLWSSKENTRIAHDYITDAYGKWLDEPFDRPEAKQPVVNQQQAWNLLVQGYQAYLNGHFQSAIEQLDQALQLDTELTEGYKWLGCAAVQADMFTKAEAAFRELIRRQPEMVLVGDVSDAERTLFERLKSELSDTASP